MSALIAAIAAVATVIVSGLAFEAARRWNRSAAVRDERIATALREIADDVDHVRALTESAIEEGRRREALNIPRPRLAGLAPDAEVEVEVIEAELPPLRDVRVETLVQLAVSKGDEQGPVISDASIFTFDFGSATQRDVREYDEKLNQYEKTIRKQLEQLRAFELDSATIVSLHVRIHNDGLVPLEDSRLVIRFPEGLQGRSTLAEPPELERVPRWQSQLTALSVIRPASRVDLSGLLHKDPAASFTVLSNSGRAEWRAGDIQHGEQRDSPALLISSASGDYTLDWEIHADNLPEPIRGELPLRVLPSPATVPVETLAAVGLQLGK